VAFEYLYDHYAGAVNGVIVRIVKNKEMADEVLQDAFLKFWYKIEQFDPNKGRLFTWMINISRNLAIDKTRSREFSQSNKTNDIEDLVHSKNNSLTMEQQTDGIGVRSFVDQLEGNQKLVVDYLYFRGYTQSELSKELDIPLGTIKTRLRSAMIALREKMNIL
jgi:RNA polymerase sigma factor (sigma-70 family)